MYQHVKMSYTLCPDAVCDRYIRPYRDEGMLFGKYMHLQLAPVR
jgi:hypothetical protein